MDERPRRAIRDAATALALPAHQPDAALDAHQTQSGLRGWHAHDAYVLFSPDQLGRLKGSRYLFLGDPKTAQPILEHTARSLHGRQKSRAIVLGNLALSHIRQRNLDAAAATLHQAIDLVELTRGGGALNVLFTAGREFRPWQQEPIVQVVQDRLLALVAAA